MQREYQYNTTVIKWIDALDSAVCQVYKELGKCRIDCIYNEICEINKMFHANTDEEIDEFAALIDIHTNQIARIQQCQKQWGNSNATSNASNANSSDGIGIRTLFHEHPVTKTKKLFSHFIWSYNSAFNIGIGKYVDEFGNINATRDGFDYIYENVFLQNALCNTSKTAHIRNELVMMKAPIIIQMCKQASSNKINETKCI
jgi:hypothetical protein